MPPLRFLCLLAVLGTTGVKNLAAQAAEAAASAKTVPLWIGWLGSDRDGLFCIAFSNGDHTPQGGQWVRLGGRVQGLQLVAHDLESQMLSARYDTGQTYELRLSDGSIKAGASLPALGRAEARKQLWRNITDILNQVAQLPAQAILDFSAEASASPDQQERFREARVQAAAQGRVYLVAKDLEGIFSQFGMTRVGPNDWPPPGIAPHVIANLTPQDWDEFNFEYAMAKARLGLSLKRSKNKTAIAN